MKHLLKYPEFTSEAKNPCWTGYKQLGTKSKKGKQVPNCVPIKESEEGFTFDELSDEAKEHAIEQNRETLGEGWDWYESIIEEFQEDMEKIGMRDVEAEFSGFYSQGDGASFTGKVADNKEFLDAIGVNPFRSDRYKAAPERFETAFTEFCDNIYITIRRDSSRYVHHNTISAELEVDGEDKIELDLGFGALVEFEVGKLCEGIEPKITEWARNRSKQLFNDLEKYYEEETSDEAVAENLRSSNYRFDEDGNMI